MTINIGTTADDKRVLHKTISLGSDITCTVKEPCSILTPVFILDYDASRTSCNYLYVPAWSRYYYIDSINFLQGHRMQLNCMIDVLQSWENSITALEICVDRQENIQERYLPDEQYVMLDNYDVISKLPTRYSTGSEFIEDDLTADTHCYVLGISGNANAHIDDIRGYTLLTAEPADWGYNNINYYCNAGTIYDPEMMRIGILEARGDITPAEANSYSTLVTIYGGVYAKE